MNTYINNTKKMPCCPLPTTLKHCVSGTEIPVDIPSHLHTVNKVDTVCMGT